MIVKDLASSAKKWSTNAGNAGQNYTSGVASTQKDQAALAAAAAPVWAQAVSQAATDGRFASRVTEAGTAKWKSGVATKGATRYPQGVAAGGANYSSGVQPYFAALSALTLPARQVKGNNIARVQAVVAALMQTRAQNQ